MWIRRRRDGKLFEVFGTRSAMGMAPCTEFLVYFDGMSSFLKGWGWVSADDYTPLKKERIAEPEQAVPDRPRTPSRPAERRG